MSSNRPQPQPRHAAAVASAPPPSGPPVIDVVVPVYNEERGLERCVRALHEHLRTHLPYASQVTIADNASTDGTLRIAQALAAGLPATRVLHLPAKGRGRALRRAWSTFEAAVLAYTDVICPRISRRSSRSSRRWCRGTRTCRSAAAWPTARA